MICGPDRCGHTRGEHRAGRIRRLVRVVLRRLNVCAECPCRGFVLAEDRSGRLSFSRSILHREPFRPS